MRTVNEWITEHFFSKPYYGTAKPKFILVTNNIILIFFILEYIASQTFEVIKYQMRKAIQEKRSTMFASQTDRSLAMATWRVIDMQHLVYCCIKQRPVPDSGNTR